MKKLIISIVSFTSPLIAFAQSTQGVTSINDATSLAVRLQYLFGLAIEVLISFAVLWIIVSVVVWLLKSGSEDAKKWRNNALWGIVGLAIILSIWGLVNVVKNTFNTSNNQIITNGNGTIVQLPTVQ